MREVKKYGLQFNLNILVKNYILFKKLINYGY